MMTSADLTAWLATFDGLTQAMVSNDDPQSLMVAAAMLFIRAQIAACGEGDDRNLRALFAFTGKMTELYIAERSAEDSHPPS